MLMKVMYVPMVMYLTGGSSKMRGSIYGAQNETYIEGWEEKI